MSFIFISSSFGFYLLFHLFLFSVLTFVILLCSDCWFFLRKPSQGHKRTIYSYAYWRRRGPRVRSWDCVSPPPPGECGFPGIGVERRIMDGDFFPRFSLARVWAGDGGGWCEGSRWEMGEVSESRGGRGRLWSLLELVWGWRRLHAFGEGSVVSQWNFHYTWGDWQWNLK